MTVRNYEPRCQETDHHGHLREYREKWSGERYRLTEPLKVHRAHGDRAELLLEVGAEIEAQGRRWDPYVTSAWDHLWVCDGPYAGTCVDFRHGGDYEEPSGKPRATEGL